MAELANTIQDLLIFTKGKKYNTIYADPPWQFQNRTGKVAPEHKRLTRYETMTLDDIKALPIESISGEKALRRKVLRTEHCSQQDLRLI